MAYEAYIENSGGLNYQGEPCPTWDMLPNKIKADWEMACVMVRGAIASEEKKYSAEQAKNALTIAFAVSADDKKYSDKNEFFKLFTEILEENPEGLIGDGAKEWCKRMKKA